MSDRNVTARDYDRLAEALARALASWWRQKNETAGGGPAVKGAADTGCIEPRRTAISSITRPAQQEQARTSGSDAATTGVAA